MTIDAKAMQELLDGLVRKHNMPGAVVGVLENGDINAWGSGIANGNTGAPMLPETLFVTGSITKIWVTTLIMMLVDNGKVALDTPVIEYLPDFRLGDPTATRTVTLRHLLTHTSGLDAADYFPDDLDWDDGAPRRFVARLERFGQLYAPGEFWSYCNPAFVVAGVLVEQMTGMTFEQAMREMLIGPLGLQRTVLSPEEAILYSAAIGHFPAPGGGPQVPTKRYLYPYAVGPCGTTLTLNVHDQLTFARMHLRQGAAPDGTTILSPSSVAEMQSHQIDLPAPGGSSSGVGWARDDRSGTLVVSHGGGSIGGAAQLAVVPEHNVAYAAFCNSLGATALLTELGREVYRMLGVPTYDPPPEPGEPAPPEYFAGEYRRNEIGINVEVEGSELVVTTSYEAPVLQVAMNAASQTVRCRPLGPHTFGSPSEDGGPGAAAFSTVGEDTNGRPRFLFAGRLARRVP